MSRGEQQTALALPPKPLPGQDFLFSRANQLSPPCQAHIILGLSLTGPFASVLREPLSFRNILPYILFCTIILLELLYN